MKKRYKIVLNLEIEHPDKPYPAGGDFAYLTRLQGEVKWLLSAPSLEGTRVTLDKVIKKE